MEPSTLLLTIFAASICFYYFVLSKLYYFDRLKIPHQRPVPLLGNMTPFALQRTSLPNLVQKIYNLFPEAKYFGFSDFQTPVFFIRDPELIAQITIKQFDNFCNRRGFISETLDPLASKNLFNLQGDHWREMRKLVSLNFTSSKMKMMFGLICQCAENFIDFVVMQSGEIGKTYDIKDILSRYANDTIATCAFGIDVDSFNYPNNEFFLLGRKAMNFNNNWITFKFFMQRNFPLVANLFKLRLFSPKVENFFKDIVTNMVRVRDEQGIVRPDMIQLMMETKNNDSGPKFDINEMTGQAFVFFLGGFESVSLAMCFMVHEIGTHPNVQRKLREEIDDVLRQTNGKPTYDAINCMKYLDAVVNEILRLYPIALLFERVCIKETELPSPTPDSEPITVKPGNYVCIPSYCLHRDAKYYPNPDKFDPERFLNGNVDNSVYMPFGKGPRICIGNKFTLMEAKIMLFHLLSRCYLEPDVQTRVPVVLSKKAITMVPEGGFWMKLRARKDSFITQRLYNGHRVEE